MHINGKQKRKTKIWAVVLLGVIQEFHKSLVFFSSTNT